MIADKVKINFIQFKTGKLLAITEQGANLCYIYLFIAFAFAFLYLSISI